MRKNVFPKIRKSPEWLKNSVIYQIFLRAFTPEGTLNAAKEHLARIAELGIDIVYLCPICLQDDDMRIQYWSKRQKESGMNNPKNPYRIKDYYSIDPEYGTDDDLHLFVKKAHSLGMRVLLDLVFFHCGPSAVFIDENPDFVKRDENGNILNGEWHFPQLNFESSDLREYLFCNMEYWIKKFDIDGYRCDAAIQVPLDFWEEGRRRIEKLKHGLIMLAESEERFEEQIIAFDLNYNYTWATDLRNVFSGNGNNASGLRTRWETMRAERPAGTRFIRYFENHDFAHDDGEMRPDKKWKKQAVDAALVVIFTIDGVPFIYNGQEIADRVKHCILANHPIDRKKENYRAAIKRFELCQKLISIRRREKALGEGQLLWVDNETPDHVLSFIRKRGNENILVLINTNEKNLNITLETKLDFNQKFEILFKSDLANIAASDKDKVYHFSLGPFAYLMAKFSNYGFLKKRLFRFLYKMLRSLR